MLLGRHMQRPRVCRAGVRVDEVPEDHVQVVVPTLQLTTPEPASEPEPLSSTRSIMGRFRDVFGL